MPRLAVLVLLATAHALQPHKSVTHQLRRSHRRLRTAGGVRLLARRQEDDDDGDDGRALFRPYSAGEEGAVEVTSSARLLFGVIFAVPTLALLAGVATYNPTDEELRGEQLRKAMQLRGGLTGTAASTAGSNRSRGVLPRTRPLLAAASAADGEEVPPTSRVVSVAAGTYSGLAVVLDCAAAASIIFAPVGLPVSVGLQHALIGFVLMQFVVSKLSGVRSMLAPTGYEPLPFLARFAMMASSALGPGNQAPLLATVLAASVFVQVVAAVLVFAASEAPLADVEKLLPPPLQAGLFAAIGYAVYLLAFDTLGIGMSAASLLAPLNLQMWLPANLLGVGLWLASRNSDSPFLFPGFILSVTAAVHAVRLATGTSLAAARDAGWLMAGAAGGPITQLWSSLSPGLIKWDLIFSSAGLKELLCAAIFGPVVNTVLNFILLGPLVKQKVDVKRELRAHAAGTAASAMGGGYSSYIALSNTAIHLKVGGTDRLSCYVAAAVCALFVGLHPLCGIVGFIPPLVIAAICVFIGVDFLWANLVDATRDNGLKAALGSAAVFALCVQKDMIWGSVLGILGFQIAAAVQRRNKAGDA